MLDRRFCGFNCKFKGTSYWAFPNYLEDCRVNLCELLLSQVIMADAL